MIEVAISYRSRHSRQPLAKIRITRLDKGDTDTGDYQVKVLVERGNSHGVFTRVVTKFPRKRWNVLALIQIALKEFMDDEEVFELDGPLSSTVAREGGGTMWEISE